MELDALSYDIRKDIINSTKKQKNDDNIQKLNEFYQTELGKAIKFVNEHEDISNGGGISNYTINKLAGVPTNVYPSIEEIKRKLIIKQIDCQNVEELIQSVRDIYIKTE